MVRCAKILASGKECSRDAESGSKYCWQHKGSRTPKKSPGRKSPKKGRKSPRKSPGKRAPSEYNLFVGKYIKEHEASGKPTKELFSEGVKQWKAKKEGKGGVGHREGRGSPRYHKEEW